MAGVTEAQIQALKKFMVDSNYTCTEEWLLACLNWLQEENNTSFNLESYKRELREQWKDSNLEVMESACLPPDLAGKRVTKLTGKYGLQVNLVRDIGDSSYSQWKKLKKLENDNVLVAATDSNEVKPAWEPTAKRCLHLTMTDGTQTVYGIEKLYCPALKLGMKPGIKIVIVGPVECRRGVMHLRPNNLRIIGGEVEEFADVNNCEKVMLRQIDAAAIQNDPSMPAPWSQTVAKVNAGPPLANEMRTRPTPTPISTNNAGGGDEVMGEFPDFEDGFPDMAEFEDGDDELLMQIDEEAILQSSDSSTNTSNIHNKTTQKNVESQIQSSSSSKTKTPSSFGNDIEDFEDDPDFISLPVPSSVSNRAKAITSKTKQNLKANPPKTNPKPKNSFVPPPSVSQTSSSAASSFQSAKTALATKPKSKTNSGSGSGNGSGNGKQVKIMQFMKPMPVIIDPPTPERQAAKRQRKKVEEGVPIQEVEIKQEKMDEEVDFDDFPSSPSDEALMQIVDEKIENKLLEPGNHQQSPVKTVSSSSSKSVKPYPIKVSDQPYVFLMQVCENLDVLAKSKKIINVKACVSTIVSNIKVQGGSWALTVSINDGTGHLECGISPVILNSIIGFSPEEMKRIKQAKTKDGKQQIAEGMNQLATALVHMNAIFEVELGSKPMIVNMVDLQLQHSIALKARLREIDL